MPIGAKNSEAPPQEVRRGHPPLPTQPTPTHLRLDTSFMQADDELTFIVDGLACKCVSNYRVRVGMNLSSKQRIIITRRVGEDAEDAVRRYRDDEATAARFAAAINALRSAGAAPAYGNITSCVELFFLLLLDSSH